MRKFNCPQTSLTTQSQTLQKPTSHPTGHIVFSDTKNGLSTY